MRRGVLITFAVAACLVAISLIALSPLALSGLEGFSEDWKKLDSVGEAYGAISALVSSLALIGVTISLLYQARAGHTSREQSIRTLQQQLIRMQMEDPALMTAMGAPWGLPIRSESAKIREYLYIHMWASFWAGNYAVGELTTAAVRGLARAELFNSTAGREYWAVIRQNVLSTNVGRYRRFARIVDEEYLKVMPGNVPVAEPVAITDRADDTPGSRKKELQRFALLGALLIAGVLARRGISRLIRSGREPF